jgi:hypothetical protein
LEEDYAGWRGGTAQQQSEELSSDIMRFEFLCRDQENTSAFKMYQYSFRGTF